MRGYASAQACFANHAGRRVFEATMIRGMDTAHVAAEDQLVRGCLRPEGAYIKMEVR